MSDKWWLFLLSGLALIPYFAHTTNLTCSEIETILGVPTHANFTSAEVVLKLSLKDCVDRCCQETSCEVAGIHKGVCVLAACMEHPCQRNFIADPEDKNATFVFIARREEADNDTAGSEAADKSDTNSKDPSTTSNSNISSTDHEADSTTKSNNISKSEESSNTEATGGSTAEKTSEKPADNNVTAPKSEAADTEQTQNNNTDNAANTNNTSTVSDSKTNAADNDTASCNPACEENELCSNVNNALTCTCKEGYISKGSACIEKVSCKAKSCHGEHNTCSVVDNTITCSCQNGYKLDKGKCIEVTCKNVTCPLHAECAVSDNNAHCFCDKEFIVQGIFCRPVATCTTEPTNTGCPANELCKQVSSTLQCFCVPGKLRAKPEGDCTANATAITLTSEDVSLTLPADTATLSVTVSPLHTKNKNYYTYKWELQKSPAGGSSAVDGLTTTSVTISKLVAGEYVFLVTVVGVHNEFNSNVVKLKVEPEARENKAPVAVINPAGKVSFKLPADFSLNGIDSHDDDKIVSYAWTIEARPVASNDHVKLTGETTDTLHVNVEAGKGEFTFKLEVKDKSGLAGTASKSVQILAEDDFPPSAKVSAALALTLPKNSAVLYGNESKDDHEITRWEWQKSGDSPKTGDMTGTTTSTLTLANLVEGTYVFTLTVYDKKNQKSTASTTVAVRPAEIGPPKADAGENKELVSPDGSTEVDGSKSTSPLGPLHFHWEQIAGNSELTLSNINSTKLTVNGLSVGTYRFKLTVVDSANVTDTDEVTVTVKEDNNLPPKAVLGSNIKLYAPNTAVDIDGSNSTDDNKIVRWEWSRSPDSPALGQVVSQSNQAPVLKLCDLIVGVYNFTLTVYDEKGASDSASLQVTVEGNPHSNDIVQVYLFEEPSNFTQKRLDSLTNFLMVPFSDGKEAPSGGKWELVTISATTINNQVVVYFYGKDGDGKIMAGAPLVQQLRQTVYGQLLGFDFDVIDTSTCSNDCSGHGTCSDATRLCTCDNFWMENFFRASAGRQFSNCEWSKVYFGIIVTILIIVCLIIVWIVWYVLSLRNDQIRRRKKYKLLEEETGRGVSLTHYDSSDDSEFYKMKPQRKSSTNSGFKTGNGFKPANVLNNTSIKPNNTSDKRK